VKLIDAAALADMLGVPETWIREHTRQRCPSELRIPHIRLGKYVRFRDEEIAAWIAAGCRVPSAKKMRESLSTPMNKQGS
jgi:predicted DNA-binding transcriptional regulator AlpA